MKQLVIDTNSYIYKWTSEHLDPRESYPNTITLGVLDETNLQAGIILYKSNKKHILASIYTDKSEYVSNWATRRILNQIVNDFCFGYLKGEIITAFVSMKNKKSINFCERLGFKVKGVIEQARADETDNIVFQMKKQDFKFRRGK